MKKMILPVLAFYLFSACSSNKSENISEADSTSSSGVSSTAEPVGIGPLSVLDTYNIKTYEAGDTTVQLPQNPAADSVSEVSALAKDTRVTRVDED